jgi:mercuric ion transport protein
MKNKSIWGTLIGALGSSFLASLCCIGPWLVIILGSGGIWTSYIGIFEPYHPYMIVFVMLLFGYSFYKLYIKPPVCVIGAICISPRMLIIQRVMFWIILAISIVLLAFPWYSAFILGVI